MALEQPMLVRRHTDPSGCSERQGGELQEVSVLAHSGTSIAWALMKRSSHVLPITVRRAELDRGLSAMSRCHVPSGTARWPTRLWQLADWGHELRDEPNPFTRAYPAFLARTRQKPIHSPSAVRLPAQTVCDEATNDQRNRSARRWIRRKQIHLDRDQSEFCGS